MPGFLHGMTAVLKGAVPFSRLQVSRSGVSLALRRRP